MARAFAAIFALVVVLAGGTVVLQGALESGGTDEVVINETFTPGSGGVVQLDHSGQTGAYFDNETTVYNASDVEMDEGTDYRWLEHNGTIDVLAGGDLAGDDNATISYSFEQTTAEQRRWAATLGVLPRALGLVLPVFVLVLLLLLVKA